MAEKNTLFMETTEIPVERTAGEITSLLVKKGARRISIAYDEAGSPKGVHFGLQVHGLPLPFHYSLPVKIEAIFAILSERRAGARNTHKYSSDGEAKDRAQAARIAWRQLYRWIEAQFAMVDAGMAKSEQVFMPFLLNEATGQTLFEYFETTGFKQLGAGQSK